MSLSSFLTETFFFEKIISQPASHRIGAEMRLLVNPGKRCAVLASSGRDGRFNLTTLVVLILVPFGMVTVLLSDTFGVSLVGAFSLSKCNDDPESKNAL